MSILKMTKSTRQQLLKLCLIFFFKASSFATSSLPSNALLHSHAENGDPSKHQLLHLTSNMKMRSSINAAPENHTPLRGRKMKADNAKSMSRNSGSDHHLDQIDPKMSSVKMHYEGKELETKRASEDGGVSHDVETASTDKRSNPVRTQTSSDMDSFVSCTDYNGGPRHHPPKNN